MKHVYNSIYKIFKRLIRTILVSIFYIRNLFIITLVDLIDKHTHIIVFLFFLFLKFQQL